MPGTAEETTSTLPRPSTHRRVRDALTIGLPSLRAILLRRRRVPAGASAHSHDRPMRPILLALLGLSLVEVPIVDLIVHPWPWLRIPLLAIGIWGVLSMVGMLLAAHMHPHAVGPDGIRVRTGETVDIELPWEVVRMVERRHRPAPEAESLDLAGAGDEAALLQVAQDATQIEVVLEAPTDLAIPGGTVRVASVRISVDDVDAFMDAVRTHIP